MKTLVIVDADEVFLRKFDSFYNKVLSNTSTLIKYWKSKSWPILFLEMGHPTLEELTSLCKGYKKAFVTSKISPDGSYEVKKALRKYKLPKELHVCGVNWNQCLQTTVYGYLKSTKATKVYAYADASNAGKFNSGYDKFHNWLEMKREYDKRLRIKYVKSSRILAKISGLEDSVINPE